MNSSSRQSSIPQLDGFRALAIGLIVIYHLGLQTSFYPLQLIDYGGWSAVQLFFVLTGFLLSLEYIYKGRTKSSFPSARQFYTKRVLRIFPLYFFSMAFYLIYGYINKSLPPVEEIMLHFIFMHNVLAQNSAIYGPYWSLAVEVQMYLVFPFIGWIIYRSIFSGKIKYLVLFLLLLILGPLAYRICINFFYTGFDLQQDYIKLIYSSTFSNLDAFGWGIAGALLYVYGVPNKIPLWVGWIALIISICVLASLFDFCLRQGGWQLWDGLFAPGIFYTLLNAAWILMILSILILKDQWISKVFSNRIFYCIALISYSIYIWHLIINVFAKYLISLTGIKNSDMLHPITLSISIVLTLGISMLSYYVIELPFLRRSAEYRVLSAG